MALGAALMLAGLPQPSLCKEGLTVDADATAAIFAAVKMYPAPPSSAGTSAIHKSRASQARRARQLDVIVCMHAYVDKAGDKYQHRGSALLSARAS